MPANAKLLHDPGSGYCVVKIEGREVATWTQIKGDPRAAAVAIATKPAPRKSPAPPVTAQPTGGSMMGALL